MINNVDYNAPEEISWTHPGLTNLMFSIPRLPKENRVYRSDRVEYGLELFMHPEQKNTAQMVDIVRIITNLQV